MARMLFGEELIRGYAFPVFRVAVISTGAFCDLEAWALTGPGEAIVVAVGLRHCVLYGLQSTTIRMKNQDIPLFDS